MKLIGIGGTNGSGKDTLGEILQDKYGWKFISLTDVLRDIARQRGLPIGRENLRQISAELREEHSTGVMIDLVAGTYKNLGQDYEGLVTASLRNDGEADRIHELGGKVIWIDADPKLRYKRIVSRSRSDDTVSFEEFIKQEQIEMHGAKNEFELRSADVKDKSDIFIENDLGYQELVEKVTILAKELGL